MHGFLRIPNGSVWQGHQVQPLHIHDVLAVVGAAMIDGVVVAGGGPATFAPIRSHMTATLSPHHRWPCGTSAAGMTGVPQLVMVKKRREPFVPWTLRRTTMTVMPRRVTVPSVVARKQPKFGAPSAAGSTPPARLAMITAYDAPSARIAHRAGADMILVGDSLAMVMLGYDDTLQVTVGDIAHHTAAVVRGLVQSEAAGYADPRPLVVGDLPWMSYHVSPEETVRNAAMLVRAGASCVKLEGGVKRIPMVRAILDAEIPVMGHIGLTPQSINAFGGFKVQGKGLAEADAVIADALALEAAGCFAIVLEAIPDALAAEISALLTIPTVGIGAGAACDGQVLVWHDLLGLEDRVVPKFVRRYGDLGAAAVAAVSSFVGDVRSGSFPSVAESYPASAALVQALADRYDVVPPVTPAPTGGDVSPSVGGPNDGAESELTCVAGLGDQAEEFLAGLYGGR